MTVRAGREGGSVAIAVADPGIGIPTQHLRHVFDRFCRVDRSRAALIPVVALILVAGLGMHGGWSEPGYPGRPSEWPSSMPPCSRREAGISTRAEAPSMCFISWKSVTPTP